MVAILNMLPGQALVLDGSEKSRYALVALYEIDRQGAAGGSLLNYVGRHAVESSL